MNWRRLLIAGIGVVVFGVAVVIVVVPGAGNVLPVDAAVEALGYDYLLVALLGVVAAVVTLLVLALRAIDGQDQATPPDPEGIETVPRFGTDVDEVIDDGLGLRTRLLGDGGEAVRDRFRETAVRTIARIENCTHADARRRVEEGAWTDDPEAASFLAGGGGRSVTWRTRVVSAFGGESPFQRGARRSAEAIVALAEDSDAGAYGNLRGREGTDPDSGGRGAERDEGRESGRSTTSEVSA